MGLLVMLVFFVALAVLGPLFGADSRLHREAPAPGRGRDPAWWPDW
jgi:hypothetical protein